MNETETSRFGLFFKRVETERAALKIVNSAFPHCRIHGLTRAAIESWRKKAGPGEKINHDAIASLLITLGQRIESLADQSRIVFTQQSQSSIAAFDILSELQNLCEFLIDTKSSTLVA